MAAVKAGLWPLDVDKDKQLVDTLWNLPNVNHGISEYANGMTLAQQFNAWVYESSDQILNKQGLICPLRISEITDPDTASADLRSVNFPGTTTPIQFKTIAVNLETLVNIDSNHFLTIVVAESTVDDRILDSCQHVDFSQNRYTDAQLLTAAKQLFDPNNSGANVQIGWAFSWLS